MLPFRGGGGFRFSLVGVPVTVHPTFLVIALLLGSSSGDLGDALVGGGVVFLSILGHELGHAIAGQAYGMPHPEVVIHALGGHTHVPVARSRWGRFATAAAGPLAGAAIATVAWGVGHGVDGEAGRMADWAAEVGWFWSLANMAPLLPLDGGRVLVELLPGAERTRLRTARIISVVTGGVAAVVAFAAGAVFITVFAAWYAATNLVELRNDVDVVRVAGAPQRQRRRRRPTRSDLRRDQVRLQQAFTELSPATAGATEAAAWAALGTAPEGGRAFPASVLLASMLVQQRHVEAWELLGRLDARDVDAYLRSLVELGPTATDVLDGRLAAGTTAAADLDLALLARAFAGRWDAAADLASADSTGRLQKGWLQLVTGWAFHSGAFAAAARLGEAAEARDAAAWTSVNVACAYARLGRPDEAVAALGRAADRGWDDRRAAERDTDLASLHGHPGWTEFLERTKANQRRPAKGRGEPFVMPVSAASAFLLCAGAMVVLLRVLPSDPDLQDRFGVGDVGAHLPDELAAVDLATGGEVWSVDELLLPTDADDEVVVGLRFDDDDTPTVVVLDAATGQQRWEAEDLTAAVLVGGTLYGFDPDGRTIRAADPATGVERWSSPGSSVAGGDETDVLVTRRDGSSALLDAVTGEERWRHEGAPPAVLPGDVGPLPEVVVLVDAGPTRSEVVGLDAATGAERWVVAADQVVHTTPTHAYVTADDGLRRVDLVTGEANPVPGEGAGLYLATSSGGTTVLGDEAQVLAVEDATGTVRWRADLEDLGTGATDPGLTEGRYVGNLHAVGEVVVVDGSAGLVALDLGTGELRWRHGDAGTYTAGVVDDLVLASTALDGLVALDAADGSERWRSGAFASYDLPVSQGRVFVFR